MSCLNDEILSALADGEQDPAASGHLADCAGCSARLASFRAIDGALKRLPLASEAPPSSLAATLRGLAAAASSQAAPAPASARGAQGRRRGRLLRPVIGMAAACAAVAVLVIAPVTGSPALALAEDAVTNHLNALASGDGSGCQFESEDPGRLAAWIHDALGHEVEVPKLAGATLVGARRCTLLGEETAAVVYRSGDTSFSLYLPPKGSAVAAACDGTSRCIEGRDGQTVCVIPDPAGAPWVMVGGLPSQDLCSVNMSG